MLLALTKGISAAIVHHAKALPIVALLLVWLFFSGFRQILALREKRVFRETLLCAACFGLAFSLLSFGCYGLMDPANGLAKPGVPAPSEETLLRFAMFGWAGFGISLVAAVLLEFSLRRKRG